MPRWPGLLLALGGALLALVATAAAQLAARGDIAVADSSLLGWLAIAGAVAFVAGLLYIAVRQLRVRSYLPPERYRGPAVLVLVLLAVALALAATVPFGSDALIIGSGEGEPSLLGWAVILTSTLLAVLLVSWLLVFRPGALEGLPSLPGRNAGEALALGIGWGAVAWLGSTLIGGVVVLIMDALGMDPQPQAAEQAIELVEPWLVIIAVVVVAPIAEEVFFRGVVFNALLREAGPRWAFIGSSALFAVIHLSLVAVVPLFLLGLAFAWIYQRTQNLLAPIAMHAVVNAVSVAVTLLVRYDVLRLPV